MRSDEQQVVFSRRRRRWSGLAIVTLMIFVAGCATTSHEIPLRQSLDQNTGVTATSLAEPIAFFREVPMLAVNSRDYIYIGPIELNRSGRREYLLWATYCSTIDRFGGTGLRAPDSAWLMLDGEPMELARAAGQTELGIQLYDSPVAGGERVIYRVTRGQMRAIARARDIRIVTQGGGSAVTEFEPWHKSRADWQRFSRYLEGELTSSMVLAYE